jgi:ankyrin repeat protein
MIDPKKKARVREALRKGDSSLLRKKKSSPKPMVEQPTAQKPLTPKEQKKLNQELFTVAGIGDTQKVNDLLLKGADVNGKDSGGWTFLMYASRFDKIQTVELLIKKGANVNAKNNLGQTPLMFASMYGHTQIVDLLRKHGAK